MMGAPGIQPKHLPPTLQEMADLIGIEAVRVIVEQRGGISLCVPSKVSQRHWLYSAIGKEAFEQLVYHYKNIELWIPRCMAAINALRDAEIIAAKQAGATTPELARKYHTTDRNIRLICARHRDAEPDPQADLFSQE